MKIPKKYQKILDDMTNQKDYLFLDSLVFVMKLNNGKVFFTDFDLFTEDGHAFYKYVYELIESFYEMYPLQKKYDSQGFARWLMSLDKDFRLSIPHHSELDY